MDLKKLLKSLDFENTDWEKFAWQELDLDWENFLSWDLSFLTGYRDWETDRKSVV